MGLQYFKTRKLMRVSTEISPHVLAYNMKHAISIFGVEGLLRMMQTT
jgi:hypothetical protein